MSSSPFILVFNTFSALSIYHLYSFLVELRCMNCSQSFWVIQMRGWSVGNPATTLSKEGGQNLLPLSPTVNCSLSDHFTCPPVTYPYCQYHLPAARSLSGLNIGHRVSLVTVPLWKSGSCEYLTLYNKLALSSLDVSSKPSKGTMELLNASGRGHWKETFRSSTVSPSSGEGVALISCIKVVSLRKIRLWALA